MKTWPERGKKEIEMNTTHTNEHTEQEENQKATQLLENLDLRDYFAAKAMQAMLSNQNTIEDFMVRQKSMGLNNGFSLIAFKAYEIADAMLEVRK
jgi:hypothetical protein